jgi:hypothetical protein
MRFLVFGLTATALVIACAAPPIPDESLDSPITPDPSPKKNGARPDAGYGPTPTHEDGGGLTPPDDSPPSDAGTGTDTSTTGTTSSCTSSADQNACYSCCEDATPAALPYLQEAWGVCACEIPGTCFFECATEYCAGEAITPGGECDTCLADNDGFCSAQAYDDCAVDDTCSPVLDCESASDCADKP